MSESGRLHITFICSGNICRSPTAEKVLAHQIAERGLSGAVHVLRAHGYPSSHDAAQVDDDHPAADLMVAASQDDFEDAFSVIEASLRALHDWVDEQLAIRGVAS
ncbi:putative low molecular weight protein tyrosine phosphatase [Mycolicibacterium doricum]|uniref:protein-tyrosine-phosphatase n=1 Tax=Mycolicibacterium doricum TaxID=126673 RepID=A0A1X1T6X6_9MYCO|nr:hypothetical protein [Mycolicibacterium doricum]MCV7267193.1 hypothetical protein [Mycolicibacterium doricum]ORV40292.1 hypothetical protein AWC01_12180 [Mycolicibacterium doricum]BBZ08279.1 putative low molecular weight protein tyrosine phosphatase [Mycolicibacterium doricum]